MKQNAFDKKGRGGIHEMDNGFLDNNEYENDQMTFFQELEPTLQVSEESFELTEEEEPFLYWWQKY